MIRKIFFWSLVTLTIVFAAQNTQVIQVRFLAWSVSMSLALMLPATFLVGVGVTLLLKISFKKKIHRHSERSRA